MQRLSYIFFFQKSPYFSYYSSNVAMKNWEMKYNYFQAKIMHQQIVNGDNDVLSIKSALIVMCIILVKFNSNQCV